MLRKSRTSWRQAVTIASGGRSTRETGPIGAPSPAAAKRDDATRMRASRMAARSMAARTPEPVRSYAPARRSGRRPALTATPATDRHRDGERRPLPGSALERHGTPHETRQLAHDVETQPGPPIATAVRAVALAEHVEYRLLVLRTDA